MRRIKLLLWLSIQHLNISVMFYLLTLNSSSNPRVAMVSKDLMILTSGVRISQWNVDAGPSRDIV
jgi:hypothetical protein